MRAAALEDVETTASYRLLADVQAFDTGITSKRAPAQIRLEAVLGRDFADRLVTALSEEHDPSPNGIV
jgi:ABC-type uncharacterized transport system auxiliary subunit